MKPTSFLADIIHAYEKYRSGSGRKSGSYIKNIVLFDHYCASHYPDATVLSQDMVDSWCARRPTETGNSCISRIYPVISLIIYMRDRHLTDVVPPPAPRATRRAYIPHAFSGDELKGFFHACDTIKPRKGGLSKLQRLELPVIFRLLYSTGMRTTEAIVLRCRDVDMSSGVISIKAGKGYGEHYVVMHDTMLDLMRVYDACMENLLPGRDYMFPTCDDKPHSPRWITYHFKVLWKRCSETKATPYELRHNYAVVNINSWQNVGFGLHDKLLALSRSMGHRDIRSTMGYYSLTPAVAESMGTTETMDESIIPDL